MRGLEKQAQHLVGGAAEPQPSEASLQMSGHHGKNSWPYLQSTTRICTCPQAWQIVAALELAFGGFSIHLMVFLLKLSMTNECPEDILSLALSLGYHPNNHLNSHLYFPLISAILYLVFSVSGNLFVSSRIPVIRCGNSALRMVLVLPGLATASPQSAGDAADSVEARGVFLQNFSSV